MAESNSKWGVNLKKVNCPKCGEEQPKVRRPKGWTEFLWGGSTFAKCGCKMDKFGVERKEKS
ncbi:MAG: hypothetical protein ACI8ZN_000622 [Bacteroidia bacterium]|jgi:hypothetical protein